MCLKNKRILIISPQAWGQMFISKHHYALALAKMGNRVYFLNPPELNSKKKPGYIHIESSCAHHNLFLIDHTLKFPFLLKFHAIKIFHLLMGYHIQKLLNKIGEPIDFVWSFDQGNLFPFKLFDEKSYKIFQPVDEPTNAEAVRAAEGSHIILSVTREILEKYNRFRQPRHLINHGIAEDFLLPSTSGVRKKKIHVGFSGNLLRPDIDRKTLLAVIEQNPAIVFECWGSYTSADNNIGGLEDEATKSFIGQLQQHGVVLHGPAPPDKLARELQRMDAFVICYDVIKDQSKGTNYHKIMEYLSTGKVIIANNVSAYAGKPELVQMIRSRLNNNAYTRLFKKVIQNLDYYNSPSLQQHRREYARLNTYINHISRIEKIIAPMVNNVPQPTGDQYQPQ